MRCSAWFGQVRWVLGEERSFKRSGKPPAFPRCLWSAFITVRSDGPWRWVTHRPGASRLAQPGFCGLSSGAPPGPGEARDTGVGGLKEIGRKVRTNSTDDASTVVGTNLAESRRGHPNVALPGGPRWMQTVQRRRNPTPHPAPFRPSLRDEADPAL